MNKSYLISLGYSIGILPYDSGIVGVIDMGDDSVIIDAKNFSLWAMIFECVDVDSFSAKYNNMYSDGNGDNILDELYDNNVIIKIDSSLNYDEQYNLFKGYRLFRQGIGIGIDKDDIYKYRVINGIENILDPLEFSVWSSANINLKVEDIYNDLGESVDKSDFVSILLSLYHSNLIYFMR